MSRSRWRNAGYNLLSSEDFRLPKIQWLSSVKKPISSTYSVAQLAERRSLAGELTLSCARPEADGWPLCGYTNSAFHPSGVDKWVVAVFIDVCSRWRHLANAYGVISFVRLLQPLSTACGSFLPVLNLVVIPSLRAGICCAVLRGRCWLCGIDLFSCKAANVFTINFLHT